MQRPLSITIELASGIATITYQQTLATVPLDILPIDATPDILVHWTASCDVAKIEILLIDRWHIDQAARFALANKSDFPQTLREVLSVISR